MVGDGLDAVHHDAQVHAVAARGTPGAARVGQHPLPEVEDRERRLELLDVRHHDLGVPGPAAHVDAVLPGAAGQRRAHALEEQGGEGLAVRVRAREGGDREGRAAHARGALLCSSGSELALSIFEMQSPARAMHWSSVSGARLSAEGCSAEVKGVPRLGAEVDVAQRPLIAKSWSNISCALTIAPMAPDQAASVQPRVPIGGSALSKSRAGRRTSAAPASCGTAPGRPGGHLEEGLLAPLAVRDRLEPAQAKAASESSWIFFITPLTVSGP